MRVLLLSTGGKIGGEETFTRNLALSLMSKGHIVEVACGGEIQQKDLESRGIKICPINISSRNPFGLNKAAKEISDYAGTNKFDIIHAQTVGPAVMGVLAKRFHGCRIPWIWQNHGITEFAYMHIVKRLNKLDLIVACSDYVKELLKGHGVKSEIIVRIHNGIAFEEFYCDDESRKANRESLIKLLGCSDSDKLFIYVGRLSPEKGVEVFLEAFEKLYSDRKNIRCVIVGDGVERENLKKQIANYTSKGNIHFLGFRSDIRELVGACDALILPSHSETFSLTTLQSFASGTPAIGSDVGGTPEQILDKFSGRLFADGNTDALKECMEEIVDREDLASYYVANARELSRNYLNTDRMTDDIINVYNRLLTR